MFFSPIFIVYFSLLVYNLGVFAVYGIDKWNAVNCKFRVPESVLLALAFLFGAFGAVSGMLIFHHKISKWKFRLCIPPALLINIAAFCLLLRTPYFAYYPHLHVFWY